MEVAVRVNTGGSVTRSVCNWKVISSSIVTWPVGGEDHTSVAPVKLLLMCFHLYVYMIQDSSPQYLRRE